MKMIILGGKYTDQIDCTNSFIVLLLAHSEKFKMNEEVDSFLSEKVSNLLLT